MLASCFTTVHVCTCSLSSPRAVVAPPQVETLDKEYLNGKVAPIAHAAYEAATSMLTTGSEYLKAGLEEARGGESAPEAAPDDEATTTTSA